MSIRAQVANALHDLFGSVAAELAVTTGFTRRRQHKIDGPAFARALVFTWLDRPTARLHEFAASLCACRVKVSTQAVAQRFNAPAAEFMQALLERALTQLIRGPAAALPVLSRFSAVQLFDSSTLALPPAFAERWPGCGGGQQPGDGAAALKLSVGWDLVTGTLCHVSLHPGRRHDRACLPPLSELPAGALRLCDLGYFKLQALAQLTAQGCFWLSRLQAGTLLWSKARGRSQGQGRARGKGRTPGQARTQVEFLTACGPHQPGGTACFQVELGDRARVPAWLLVERVPAEVAAQRREELAREARRKGQPVSAERLALANWTLLVTNVPPHRLTVPEALALYRVRWQIELLFKLWKSDGALSESRSKNPQRILCEVFGKLLALVIEHWLLLLDDWRQPDSSWRRAAAHVRRAAWSLLTTLDSLARLDLVLDSIARVLQADCRISSRRQRPATFQRLKAACGG